MDDIGWRLRRWREALGVSQAEIARVAGVSGPMVSYWEHPHEEPVTPKARRGKRAPKRPEPSPSIRSLARIVDFMEITLAEFFEIDPPPAGSLDERRARVREWIEAQRAQRPSLQQAS